MTHSYNISNVTCNKCVAKIKNELLKMGDIAEAEIQVDSPQAKITMLKHIPVAVLQEAISKAGDYKIEETTSSHTPVAMENASWWKTYKPVLIIGAYLLGITTIIEISSASFVTERWMMNFMGGFFITFSLFKMLDIRGFAEAYSSYDVIAKRIFAWGFVYPFVELGLGIAYIMHLVPTLLNGLTFAIMSISIIGVIDSVMHKRKIQCACLGAVLNLPMSTVTIVEDGLMILMSAIMFFHLV